MQSAIKQRLLDFIDQVSEINKLKGEKSMGQTKFEAYVNIPTGTISKTGEGISTTTASKIKEKFPSLNLNWLITGEGSMLLAGNDQNKKGNPNRDPRDQEIIDLCKHHYNTLTELLRDKINYIYTNSNLALLHLNKINLDTDSMRTVTLESLNRLEKKPAGELLKAADKIKDDRIAAADKQGSGS